MMLRRHAATKKDGAYTKVALMRSLNMLSIIFPEIKLSWLKKSMEKDSMKRFLYAFLDYETMLYVLNEEEWFKTVQEREKNNKLKMEDVEKLYSAGYAFFRLAEARYGQDIYKNVLNSDFSQLFL